MSLTESEFKRFKKAVQERDTYNISKNFATLTFSPKYNPLFDILKCKEIVKDSDFKELYTKKEQKYWKELYNVDTIMMSGGRDSGKSFALSSFNIVGAKHYSHRILYTRQTMSSTDNSITEALEQRMDDLQCEDDFEAVNKTYSAKYGNGKITITGQQTSKGTQTAKLKSLEDYSIFETDEGEELESYDKWKKVKRSIRAKDVQSLSIISFNPPTREHWIYETFYEDIPEGFNGVKGKILYIHTTYLDNGKENMAEHNWLEYEDLRLAYEEYLSTDKDEREMLPIRLVKKYREYKSDILGGFKDVAEGVIYEDWEMGEFNNSLPYCYGMDFGFNDPDVIVKIAVNEGEKLIHIDQILNKNGLGTDKLAIIMMDRIGHNDLIIADAAQARLINDLYYKGLNIKRCKKRGGSVERTIKTLQGYTLVITERSKDVKKAFNNYVWHDKRSGVPRNEYKHFPDAIGYGAIELIFY